MQKPPGVKIGTETGTDKQNPKATIGFVVHYPFHYFVYKNIYKHIEEISEFIVDMGAFSVEQPPELLSEIILLLEKERVFYRVLNFNDYYYRRYLSSFIKKYNLLVSVWESGCVAIQETEGLKKVHVTYGAGKELTFLRPSQSIYDLTLDYGKRSANLHAYFSYPVITGNAKFDDWFNDTLDKSEILLIQSKLDKNKKTILYLPTHGDLSSVEKIIPELISISRNYNIIIKLHYYIEKEEPERLKLLSHKNFLLYKDNYDLLLLLKVSDMVLSDNSSAIFDAMLADKPVLVTDYLSIDFLNREHLKKKTYRRGSIGALTYSDSIEQKIKKDGSVLTITKKGELGNKIIETLNDRTILKENRKKIRDEIFEYNDGNCGKRGADAILYLLKNEGKKQKTIMHHAIEAYKASIDLMTYSEKDWLEKRVTFYEDKLNDYLNSDNYFFSIIVIRENNNNPFFLEPLTRQNFSRKKFEIIVINEGEDKDNNNFPENIKLVSSNNLSLGEKITKAIKISEGNIICFTTSSVIVRNDWLIVLYATYHKDKTISGCGGYKFLENNLYFNYFYMQEIANKIGLGLTKGMWDIYNLSTVTNNNFLTNPVGMLCNSSYKKKCISEIQIISDSIYEIELILKEESLKHGPLSFTLNPVIKRSTTTFKEFLYENMMCGFSKYIFYKKNTQNTTTSQFIEIIIYTLAQMSKGFFIQNIIMISVIFIGHFSRYVGFLLGIIFRKLTLLDIKIKDIKKII